MGILLLLVSVFEVEGEAGMGILPVTPDPPWAFARYNDLRLPKLVDDTLLVIGYDFSA